MSHLDKIPPTVFALPRSHWGPRDNGLNWPAPPGFRNYKPPHRDTRTSRGTLTLTITETGTVEIEGTPAICDAPSPPCEPGSE